MAYTRITAAKHGRASLDYILSERAHNGKEKRNEYLTGVNLFDGVPVQDQMAYYWNLADERMQVQTRRVVVSFSRKEFDPENQEHIRQAGELCRDGLAELFPDRQILVAVQTDGKGGNVHVHGIVNNVSMTDHHGLRDSKKRFWYLKEGMNKYLSEHGVELDAGEKQNKGAQTQTERTFDENGKYVWKADLRQRVETARQEATSYEDFKDRLSQAGVAYDDTRKHNTFTMDEAAYIENMGKEPKKPLHMRGKTIGEDYTAEVLKAYFDRQTEADQKAIQIFKEMMAADQAEKPTEQSQEPQNEVSQAKIPRRSAERTQRTQKPQEQVIEPAVDIVTQEKGETKGYLRGNIGKWLQETEETSEFEDEGYEKQ